MLLEAVQLCRTGRFQHRLQQAFKLPLGQPFAKPQVGFQVMELELVPDHRMAKLSIMRALDVILGTPSKLDPTTNAIA